MRTSQLLADREVVQLARLIADSYPRVVGDSLIELPAAETDERIAAALYEHPAVVLSHDGAPDPTFTFANQAAQELFEYSWDEFLTLRSHQSAEPQHRSDRAEMLERAARDGYIADYRGVRISGSGKRFEIENAIIWSVRDQHGTPVGQAAVFDQWKFLTD